MIRRNVLVAVAGLAAGLMLAFVVPSSWLGGGHAGHHEHGDGQSYACPMFCVILDHKPADGRCPVCGMELTPVADRTTLDAHERHMVGLDAERLARRPLERAVRVVGEVDYDETRLSRITTRAGGWLEKVWIDATWMTVTKGEKLAAIYSPELYASQKEFLAASGPLRDAARRRLRLLGISDEEIDELATRGAVEEALVLRSPRAGVVTSRQALEGASVKKGDLLYTVADLSRVWVQAEVFERDLVWVTVGQTVRLQAEGMPEFEGRVAFIDPALDRHMRTARVRIEVDNPDGRLRIGQRVDAWIRSHVGADGLPSAAAGAEPLAVPRSAVLATGRRQVVYRLFTKLGDERDMEVDPAALPETVFYELVEVKLGPLAERDGIQYYPVLEGLAEGETVVTSGNLLLDSQAQLSGKPSLLFPEGSRAPADDPHAGH